MGEGIPAFFQFESERIENVRLDAFGGSASWSAPCAVIEAPQGFSHEAWSRSGTLDTVLAWVLSGCDVRCEWGRSRGRFMGLRRGNATLQPHGAPNHYSARGPIRFAQFVVTPALLARVADDLRLPGEASRLRDDLIGMEDARLHTLLNAYVERAGREASRLEMEARAVLVVDHLLREHHGGRARRETGVADRRIRRVLDRIEGRLGENHGLGELAAEAEVSPAQFVRLFRAAVGVTPHVHVNQRRIERACERLATTRLSVLEIALSLGFSSSQHFATAFRRRLGLTPSQYRRDRLL